MNGRRIAQLALLLLLVTGMAVGLARLFSGPEDGWVRNANGKWVAHGHPAGPPPPDGYRPPLTERVVPWVVLGLFAVGGLVAAATSARARANRDELNHMVRVLGTVSTLAWVAALCVMIGLVSMLANGLGSAFEDAGAAMVVLAGMAGFTGLLGAQMHTAKKVLEAHYDLKRSIQMLQDTVERLTAGADERGPSRG